MSDAYEEMMNVRFEDGFQNEDDDFDWKKREKEDFGFCVGEGEQKNLATKTVKVLANIRDRQGR